MAKRLNLDGWHDAPFQIWLPIRRYVSQRLFDLDVEAVVNGGKCLQALPITPPEGRPRCRKSE